ncbi:MAG: hypothetical protein JNM56_37040 [Planctomycetia bacterium]|nr:hypothetical protein [Planctomycetia bacterium]
MKQKIYGRKVQNWHRPLGPQQLRRSFRRYREGAPLDAEELDYCHDYDWYEAWDGDGPRDEGSEDLLCHELKQLSRAALRRPPRLFRPEWATDDVSWAGAEQAAASERTAGAEHLEEQLAAFVQGIKRFPNDPATRRRIADSVGEDVYRDVLQSAATPGKGENLVRNVSLFAPFWIRSPRTWDGGKTSLVNHLLVRYDVPRFLDDCWFDLPGHATLKWLSWFILLAQGGSLKRAATFF